MLLPIAALAQVRVTIEVAHESYLKYEAIPVRVKLTNQTNQAIVLGGIGDTALLEFVVKKAGKSKLKRNGRAPILRNIVLLPGQHKEVEVDLKSHYDMKATVKYDVKATITYGKMLSMSGAQVVEVVPGMKVTSSERSVPDHPSWMRTYVLRCWARDGKEHMFLHVLDKKKKSHGVFDLGPSVRLIAPTIRVNISGVVVVKHQSGRRSFSYTWFQSDETGVLFLRQRVATIEKPTPVDGEKAKD